MIRLTTSLALPPANGTIGATCRGGSLCAAAVLMLSISANATPGLRRKPVAYVLLMSCSFVYQSPAAWYGSSPAMTTEIQYERDAGYLAPNTPGSLQQTQPVPSLRVSLEGCTPRRRRADTDLDLRSAPYAAAFAPAPGTPGSDGAGTMTFTSAKPACSRRSGVSTVTGPSVPGATSTARGANIAKRSSSSLSTTPASM